MSQKEHDNFYLKASKHLDDKYFNENNEPYASTAAVLSRIPKAERVKNGTHNVLGIEYWFKDNTDTLVKKGGDEVALTSEDGSVIIDGYDLSVPRSEIQLYASNETELLAAWVIAYAEPTKPVRIWITGNIVFTADRSFIQPYEKAMVKMEAITPRNFDYAGFIVKFNNVVHVNLGYRTTGLSYFTVEGGLYQGYGCYWVDDVLSAGTRKKNIVVTGDPLNGVAKIVVKNAVHYSQVTEDNASGLLQPFWVSNETAYTSGTNARLYFEMIEMSAVYEQARFARVLLTSTVADCPYSVTGDESWFYAPEQELIGEGNIASDAILYRTTYSDRIIANRLLVDETCAFSLGLDANGEVKKTSRSAGDGRPFNIILPASADVATRCLTPTYLPDGWTVAAGANPNDLVVTHNLERSIAWVTVFSINGSEEQLLKEGSDYLSGGLKANSSSILTIQGFAKITLPVRINLFFS